LESRVLVGRGVDGDEPGRERGLGVLQAALRDPELEAGALLVAFDARKLDVGRVVGLHSPLEVDVEPVDLREHLARLALFGRNRRIGRGRTRGGEECREGDDERWRQPLRRARSNLPGRLAAGAPGGPVRHEWGTLARASDARNRGACVDSARGGPLVPRHERGKLAGAVVRCRPVRPRAGRLPAPLLTLLVGGLLAGPLPASARADSAPALLQRAYALRAENTALA